MIDYSAKRGLMVEGQLVRRGIRDPRVLEVMGSIPRHAFLPESLGGLAYEDSPLSIGHGQTISQPYMVALMTECLEPGPEDRVLEIGTGSGYQTSVLAELAREVHSVERIPQLAEQSMAVLSRQGYENVIVHTGDGSEGLPKHAPFDAILVTAGSPGIPEPLLEQLVTGGRLVIPLGGSFHQSLIKVVMGPGGMEKKTVTGCVFVPLIGAYGWEAAPTEERNR